jgi:RecA-family ATPase
MGQDSSPSDNGAIIYIAGEGHGGIGARIKACRIHHGIDNGAPIYVLRHQVNLRSSADDINTLMLSIAQLQEDRGFVIDLIVIDTLARAFGGGNENSSEDMGAFITSCGHLQQVFAADMAALGQNYTVLWSKEDAATFVSVHCG